MQKKQEYQKAKVQVISFNEDVICTSDDYARDIYDVGTWGDENIRTFQG